VISHLEQTTPPPAISPELRVLLVDDDEDDALLFRELVSGIDWPRIHLTWVNDYDAALTALRETRYDVHFVDYRLGDHSGLQLLAQVMRSDPTRAFVLITGCGNEAVAVETIRMGAADYVSKADLSKEELLRAIGRCFETVQKRTARWQQRQMALFDGLTGVYRKESFLRAAGERIEADANYAGDWTMLFIDIDGFKQVNDTRGHIEGDLVLSRVVGVISSALRTADLIGRFGGDEFCVLTRGGKMELNMRIAERVRRCVQRFTDVTVSIGVASEHAPQADLTTLIARSDEALYAAKQQGRNRVVVWSPRAD
jgi:diguanylate cyclase (GGDEF)-like protein